jgi:hypothetical protein
VAGPNHLGARLEPKTAAHSLLKNGCGAFQDIQVALVAETVEPLRRGIVGRSLLQSDGRKNHRRLSRGTVGGLRQQAGKEKQLPFDDNAGLNLFFVQIDARQSRRRRATQITGAIGRRLILQVDPLLVEDGPQACMNQQMQPLSDQCDQTFQVRDLTVKVCIADEYRDIADPLKTIVRGGQRSELALEVGL